MPRPFVPQTFGKYTLCDKLAVGGMAEIFLARLPAAAPGSFLVIKRILPHYSGNSQFTDMFIDEARISFLLRHENVILTPHLGGATHETLLQGAEMIADEILRFAAGEPLVNVVNRSAVAA